MHKMALILPSVYTSLDQLPKPNNEGVHFDEVPPLQVRLARACGIVRTPVIGLINKCQIIVSFPSLFWFQFTLSLFAFRDAQQYSRCIVL